MQPGYQAGIATQLILPAWWVRAYEASMQREGLASASAMEHACAARLVPALNPVELNSLAVVVANLQAQILAGRQCSLSIDLAEHLKHAGSFSRSRLFAFERIIQQLPGVRVLSAGDQGVLRSFPLFSADRWVRRGEGPDDFTIELTTSPLGAEQLLGFADAHMDLIRYARREAEASEALGSEPPLSIWRSIWLELQGIEQVLFMRIERCMQWDFRWLQLEGVFGLPMGELFSGLTVPEARFGDDGSPLARRLKVLARLGRKLTSQGFLGPQAGGQYLALNAADDEDLLLVWQMSRERLLTDVMRPYRAAFGAHAVRNFLGRDVDALVRIALPGAGSEALEDARALWGVLRDRAALPESSLVGLHCEQSRTLSPQMLFFELCLRCSSPGRFPVPEPLLAGPLGTLVASTATEGALERFAQFCRLIDESFDFERALREVPLASFAALSSRTVDGFEAYVRSALVQETTVLHEPSPDSASSDAARPRLVAQDEQIESAQPQPVPPEENAPQRVAVGAASLSGVLASRMRKTAADELQRMESNDEGRYRALKKAYFDSLDNAGRRLIVDIQKRMQPAMFEDHLRQRLVRFMVENPGAWRSADARPDGSRAFDLR